MRIGHGCTRRKWKLQRYGYSVASWFRLDRLNEPLLDHLTKRNICHVPITALNRFRSLLIAYLRKQFVATVASGLTGCTKSKAHPILRPDARPFFKKPVPHRRLIICWPQTRCSNRPLQMGTIWHYPSEEIENDPTFL